MATQYCDDILNREWNKFMVEVSLVFYYVLVTFFMSFYPFLQRT